MVCPPGKVGVTLQGQVGVTLHGEGEACEVHVGPYGGEDEVVGVLVGFLEEEEGEEALEGLLLVVLVVPLHLLLHQRMGLPEAPYQHSGFAS